MVFAVHSFGGLLATAFIRKYPEKVIGIIEFGAVPGYVYTSLKMFGVDYIFGSGDLSPATLINNIENLYKQYKEWAATFPSSDQFLQNTKYSLLAFYLILGENKN